MNDFTLRKKIEESKAEYQERYGKLDWHWTDEGVYYAMMDYHSIVGSVLDFTEDDWRVCKENGIGLDDVCAMCDEEIFSPDVDNLADYFDVIRITEYAGTMDAFYNMEKEEAILH